MASFTLCLLLVAIQLQITDCSKRNLKLFSGPYGPKMCRELFCSSSHAFLYVTEQLSCYRLLSINDSTDLANCLGRVTHNKAFLYFSPERACCNKELKDVCQPNQPPWTRVPFGTDHQELDRVSCSNILHRACETGNLFLVKFILSHNLAEIDVKGKRGRTPVMVAAKMGKVEVFDFLVSQSCDLNAVDERTDNILHFACEGGHSDIVRTLVVSLKYDMENRGWYERTAVMTTVSCGHTDVFDFLVSFGCDLSAVDQNGSSVLHVATIGGHLNMVEQVLSLNEYDIDIRDGMKRTPLMLAVYYNHIEVFQLLASRNSKMGLVDADGNNILHIACKRGHLDMVKDIVSKQIFDVDIEGMHGRSPVMIAVYYGHFDVVDFLISKGCNLISVSDDNNDNVLHMACMGGHLDMVKYIDSMHTFGIDSRGKNRMTPILMATYFVHKDIILFLIEKGCKINSVDGDGANLLHAACIGGDVEIVDYFYSNYRFEIESKDNKGRTPVMLAADYGRTDVVKLLVEKGCDLSLVDELGNNILHYACGDGNTEMVRYLITTRIRKNSANEKNRRDETPLSLASLGDYTDIVNILETWVGADFPFGF